jgi:hypothetical protein
LCGSGAREVVPVRNVTFIVLLCLSLCVYAPSESPATRGDPVIGGVVKNADGSALMIGNDEVVIGDGGAFAHRLDVSKSSYVTFKLGEELSLYLSPGDSLHVEFNAERFYDSMRISGRGEKVNRFILGEAKSAEKMIRNFNRGIQFIAAMDEAGYADYVNSLAGEFVDRLEVFIAEWENTDEYFVRTQRATIEYSKAKALLDYPYLRRRFAGVAGFWPTKEYFRFVDDLDLNNPELLEVDEYRSFLDAYVTARAEDTLRTDTAFAGKNYKEFRAKHHVVLETFTDPTIRSEMLYSVIRPLASEYELLDTLHETGSTRENQ